MASITEPQQHRSKEFNVVEEIVPLVVMWGHTQWCSGAILGLHLGLLLEVLRDHRDRMWH